MVTLHELITALRNVENVGANRGERGGGDRRVTCQYGDDVNDSMIGIADIEIRGGDIVLHLCEVQ